LRGISPTTVDSSNPRRGFVIKVFKSVGLRNSVVILLTIGLFGLSLGVEGITHELFLEAGVLLISVKLILITAKNAGSEEWLERDLRHNKKQLATR
jgi:hypothetical protein